MNANLKPRVCAVSYLNTVPLVWGMLHGDQRSLFDLSFSIPAECARRLADGQVDVGLVPGIELSRQKLNIIKGAGIACHGPVRSILLISKVPFHRISRLAVDSSSRTSVMLTRIILARKYGVEPQFSSAKPDLVAMLDDTDACLIIGDPALLIDPASVPFHVLDLGAEWTALTGLPMVFAVWSARASLPVQDPLPYMNSLRFGMNHIEQIVEEQYQRRGILKQLAHEYLTRHIVFELHDREYEGLALFLQYAAELHDLKDIMEVTV